MIEHYDTCGINKFVERDIDMLVAEELRVNEAFGNWVMDKFGVSADLIFPAIHINVSVVEDGSEADVVATFKTKSNLTHRLFIENKIDAGLMPEQLERYIRRAEGDVRRKLISSFSVLFFTPSSYLSRGLPLGVKQISFEEAAEALASQGSLRSSYRASLLMKALPIRTPTARDAHVASTDPYIRDWWDQVYAMLDHEFPGFFVHKTRYPRSVYFAPETPGQARYLRVDFKGQKGEVDLAFKNIPADVLKRRVSKMEQLPGRIVANGKSCAIQISGLAPFVISDGFEIIETRVRAAYQAACTLLTFWQQNRVHFDAIASAATGKEPTGGVLWTSDGGLCPICAGIGRGSIRYPAALCESCAARVVDEGGNPVQLFNEGFSGGLEIRTHDGTFRSPKSEEIPLFANGVECRAREHHFGGVVIQPIEAWKTEVR